MTYELGPYSKWLVAVATEVAKRRWMVQYDLGEGSFVIRCMDCGAPCMYPKETKHDPACRFAALDAALDAEPKE